MSDTETRTEEGGDIVVKSYYAEKFDAERGPVSVLLGHDCTDLEAAARGLAALKAGALADAEQANARQMAEDLGLGGIDMEGMAFDDFHSLCEGGQCEEIEGLIDLTPEWGRQTGDDAAPWQVVKVQWFDLGPHGVESAGELPQPAVRRPSV